MFSVGFKILVTNNSGEILILKRAEVEALKNLWDIPGGRLEYGESVRNVLERELLEEVGLKLLNVIKPLAVTTFLKRNDRAQQVVQITFHCEVTGEIKLSKEHSVFKWVKLTELKKYDFMDETIFKAINNLNGEGSQDFLGEGMINDSLEFLKNQS